FSMLWEINRDIGPSWSSLSVATESQLVSEIGYAHRSLQTKNALVPVIIYQHDGQPNAFSDRGHNLRVHHEIGAVTNHHHDLTVWVGQLGSQTSGDLVAHTGIAIFQMIGFGIFRPPKPQQLSGQSPGCAHNGSFSSKGFIDQPDHRSFGQLAWSIGFDCAEIGYQSIPFPFFLPDLIPVLRTCATIPGVLEGAAQCAQRALHIGDERKRLQLMHIHRCNIDSNKSYGWILERGFGGRREIA